MRELYFRKYCLHGTLERLFFKVLYSKICRKLDYQKIDFRNLVLTSKLIVEEIWKSSPNTKKLWNNYGDFGKSFVLF